MNRASQLVRSSLRALRRSTLWWAAAVVGFSALNLAFWPSLRDSAALSELEGMSDDLLAAFGAQHLSTPAGYLDGQMYALMLPVLLSIMVVASVTAITSGDEGAGRSELLHVLPITRREIWVARLVAALLQLAAVTATLGLVVVFLRSPLSMEEVPIERIVAATIACGLLAMFHAVLAWSAGALGRSRPACVSVAIGVLVAGYLMDFVIPLARSLRGIRRASPWWWAIGDQPVSDGIRAGWLLLLVATTLAVAAVGAVAVERRDIAAA